MNFMSPPTFDILNIQIWKVKMSLYLKALGIHVYLATTNNAYCLNGKNIKANAKALHALKSTLYAPEKERGNCCKDFFESDEKITTRLFLPVTREGGC